jgi:prolipoprotein diacylglyceryltransferase
MAASRRVLQRQKVASWRDRDFHKQGIPIGQSLGRLGIDSSAKIGT